MSKRKCTVEGCGGRHSPLLHDHFVVSILGSKSQAMISATRVGCNKVYLQTLPVRLHTTNGRVVDTFAMLDSGSQATLITKSFAEDLGLNGPTAELSIGNIRENETPRKSKKVTFYLSDPHNSGAPPLKVHNAWTFDGKFNLPCQTVPLTGGTPDWPHVRDLNLSHVDSSQITILIGVDTKRAIVQLEVREGTDNLPMAVKTP